MPHRHQPSKNNRSFAQNYNNYVHYITRFLFILLYEEGKNI